MRWVIFDLDGTLCDISHRLHYIRNLDPEAYKAEHPGEFKPDWDSFHKACSNDAPKNEIVELARMLVYQGARLAIFSGRDATYESLTVEWLSRVSVPWHMLVLRKPRDYRSDFIVKKEMFEQRFKLDQIWFVVEDRDQVVKMWRDLGLTCLQCQKGEY